jgi:hypothetical protein
MRICPNFPGIAYGEIFVFCGAIQPDTENTVARQTMTVRPRGLLMAEQIDFPIRLTRLYRSGASLYGCFLYAKCTR